MGHGFVLHAQQGILVFLPRFGGWGRESGAGTAIVVRICTMQNLELFWNNIPIAASSWLKF